MTIRNRLVDLRQNMWLSYLDAVEARDIEAAARLREWSDEIDAILVRTFRRFAVNKSADGEPVMVEVSEVRLAQPKRGYK